MAKTPYVGIGIILRNEKQQILVGRRKNSHAPYYSIPGGHMEIGETFLATARRELEEETGLILEQGQVIAITNNLETYQESGLHYVSVVVEALAYRGNLENREPNKCEGWICAIPTIFPSHILMPADNPSPAYCANQSA